MIDDHRPVGWRPLRAIFSALLACAAGPLEAIQPSGGSGRAMAMGRTFRILGGWSIAIAVLLGMSYCSELPIYRFERMATEMGHRVPGARLISSIKTARLTSPLSWFWPTTETWNFAWPDPMMLDRFHTFTLVHDENSPIVFLVDADCETREQILYGLDAPESALPALDVFGEPVMGPNGKTYRRLKIKQDDLPAGWLHEFCDTDWTAERNAAQATSR